MDDQRSRSVSSRERAGEQIPTELQRTLPAAAYLGQEGWGAEVEGIFRRDGCGAGSGDRDPASGEGDPFDPQEMRSPAFDPSDAIGFWDLVNRQDWRIGESVQRGMSARLFQYGYYAPMEDLARHPTLRRRALG